MARGRRRQPRQARSRALVDAIVEAATQLLADSENDPNKLSVKAIARRAGVGIGSVYEYFSDRDGIIDAIIDRLADINFSKLSRVLDEHADEPIYEAFVALMDASAAAYLDAERLTRFSFKTAMRFDRMDFVIRERDRFTKLIADRIMLDYPRAGRTQAEHSALAATEALSGIVMGELYRKADPARRAALREAMLRFVRSEVDFLRARHDEALATAESGPPVRDDALSD